MGGDGSRFSGASFCSAWVVNYNLGCRPFVSASRLVQVHNGTDVTAAWVRC